MGRNLSYLFIPEGEKIKNIDNYIEDKEENFEFDDCFSYRNYVPYMYQRTFTREGLKDYIANSVKYENFLEACALSFIMSEWDDSYSLVVINSN